MFKLEDITKDAQIRALHRDEVVKVVSVDKGGDSAISAVYQKSAVGYGDQMLFCSDECRFELAQASKAWALDAPGITVRLPVAAYGCIGDDRYIEVKGRVKGSTTVTKNENFSSYNEGEKNILAIVLVDGELVDGPCYIKHPFKSEPEYGVGNVNYELSELLPRAIKPEESL